MNRNVYKENYDLKKRVEFMRKDFCAIAGEINCTVGPLSANSLRYTKKQLRIFDKILFITDKWEEEK